jgi:hypothetical protein
MLSSNCLEAIIKGSLSSVADKGIYLVFPWLHAGSAGEPQAVKPVAPGTAR